MFSDWLILAEPVEEATTSSITVSVPTQTQSSKYRNQTEVQNEAHNNNKPAECLIQTSNSPHVRIFAQIRDLYYLKS